MLWLFRPADAFRLTDVIHAIGFSISATGIVYLGLDLFQAPDLVVGLLILCGSGAYQRQVRCRWSSVFSHCP
ncbi:MAG: hypothetical protein KVP17_001643 [Porospora cf. gigantea B]|uniref:uncharacterized protein n=1 Tax=Porospora cf. gigantea B TaxID=2853592 RepID=UPI0035719D10|nr:MAG: hypothetical protein KVP17_001643 [Porospora cf. gigantea B]